MTRVERCACGGEVRADPMDPTPGVERHNRTQQHRAWRGVQTKQCPGYGSPCAVTIPVDRDLCYFCKGTRRLVERVAAA